MSGTFLPDRFRPNVPRKSSRGPLLAIALVPMTVALFPMWRVQAVDVSGCAGMPAVVRTSLEELAGRPILMVSPERVRHQLEAWPEVAGVEVRLELPGTLRVSAERTVPCGSVGVGRGWHAVTESGGVGGRLDGPLPPVFEGVACRPQEIRRALAVTRRIEKMTGGRVESTRVVTPATYEVRLRPSKGARTLVMQVGPAATLGEMYWSARVAAGDTSADWVDLRWDDRIVLGGIG